MKSFLDIADEVRSVTINGEEVPLAGLPASSIALLFRRFPEIQQAIGGEVVEFSRWSEIGAEAISAIAAAGLGFPGHKEAEAKVSRLPLHVQIKIIGDVMDMTWPGVTDPLVRRVEALAANYLAAIESDSTESEENDSPTTTSRSRSKG